MTKAGKRLAGNINPWADTKAISFATWRNGTHFAGSGMEPAGILCASIAKRTICIFCVAGNGWIYTNSFPEF